MKFLSQLVTAASGSIGGLVASRNRYGAYMRAKVIPVNPATAIQSVIRNIFAGLVAAWKSTLTAAQRLAWKQYAINVTVTDALGQAQYLQPQNWYVGCNTPRLQAGLDRVDDAPADFTRALLTSPTATVVSTSAAISIAFDITDPWANAVGGGCTVAVSAPQNETVEFFKGPYQYAGVIEGAAAPLTSPKTVQNPYGAAPAGTKTFIQLRALEADGRTSIPFPVSDIST